ncbi:MAG TPA: PQQ-binding-like beta-propeller repeat protein, partial [Burkholderiales bacterium]
MKIVLALVLAAFLAGCQTIGGYYDRLLGRPAGGAQKPTELEPVKPTAEMRVVWQASVGSAGKFAFAPAVAGDAVYATNAAGEVIRLDAATGKVEWRVETGTQLSTGPGSDGRVVVAGSPRGEVVAVEASGKLLWKAYLTGEI